MSDLKLSFRQLTKSPGFTIVAVVTLALGMNALNQMFRRLARERGFTATALLTLALCIGANVTIFGVVDAVMLRVLPFPDPDRLVTVFNSYPGTGDEHSSASLTNYFNRRGNIPALELIALFAEQRYTVGEEGAAIRADGARITPDFFATLGVPLAMGRMFTDENFDDQARLLTSYFLLLTYPLLP